MAMKRDPKTGKFYVVNSPSSFYESKTSSSKSFPGVPTYDAKTGVYTDASGNKKSMDLSNALRSGAVIQNATNQEQAKALFTPSSSNKRSSSSASVAPSPVLAITEYKREKGGRVSEVLKLGSASAKLDLSRGKLRTQKLRGSLSKANELKLLGLTALSTVVDFGKGFVDLPETAYRIARKPSLLKQIPGSISQSGKEFGEMLRVSPGEAFVQAGANLLLLKGSSSAINKLNTGIKTKAVKISPKYVGDAKIGRTLKIPTKAGKIDLKVVGKIPVASFKKQVGLAGKKVNAISSQGDRLLAAILSRSKSVKKPIPGEAAFTRKTKDLLKKFDSGTLKAKDIKKLNDLVKKQGAKGLLERSFFADPTGKIRPSRLGIQAEKKGSLIDYLSSEVSFKKARPQILFFENVKVQSLPKALKSVGTKLKRKIPLSKNEADRLLKFQLQKSNKFKPIGFISGESEITLAPGEILKRTKVIGKTVINKRVVPIIKTEVYKPSGMVKDLLKKYTAGKLTKSKVKQLDKLLKKKTGFNYGLSSSAKAAKGKYISIKRIGLSTTAIFNKFKKNAFSGSKKKVTTSTSKVSKTLSINRVSPRSPRTKPKGSSLKLSPSSRPKGSSPRKSFSKSKTMFSPTSSKASSPGKSPYKRKTYSRPISRKKSSSPVNYKRPISPKSPYSPRRPPKYPPKYPGKIATFYRGKPKPSRRKRIDLKAKEIYQKSSGKKVGYFVYEKRRGKFYKIRGKPLRLSDAKDKLAYRLDNRISRTARLVKVKANRLGRLKPKEKGYFSRVKKNLKASKIVRGKRIKTPMQFIEKRGRGVINTRGEKTQLALNRRTKVKYKFKGRVSSPRRRFFNRRASTRKRR